jgi:hypothetical protein
MLSDLFRAAMHGLAVVAVGYALAGCPDLVAPSGCTPNATRCAPSGAPEVCSPTQRWTRR